MKSIFKLCVSCICFLCILPAQGQRNHSRAFFSGYFGYFGDSSAYNNIYVERRDTGLYFSHRYASEYDFFCSQSSTYCDSTGKPLIVWQGCYILDGNNLSPIENGDFSHTQGARIAPPINFCDTVRDITNRKYNNSYSIAYSTFFLDRGVDSKLLLVYYRWHAAARYRPDSCYIHSAFIDLIGSNGQPAVLATDKDAITPVMTVAGSIQPIRHANGRDWYIVFKENYSANWYSMLYDEQGLHKPVLSTILEWNNLDFEDGYTAVSPDGTKYAFVSSNSNAMVVLNFDRCTGKFTHLASGKFPDDEDFLNTSFYRFCEFSPSGRFVYLNSVFNIYQFDLEADDISDSRTHIAEFDTAHQKNDPRKYPAIVKGYFCTPFRGLDGRIYYWSSNTVQWISRIRYPDRKGPEVGLQQDYTKMPFYPPWVAPTMVDYDMGPLAGAPCTDAVHSGQQRQDWPLYPNPTSGMIRCDAVPDKYLQQQLQIIDSRGRHVMSTTGADLLHGVDVRQLEPGVYILKSAEGVLGRFVRIE